MRRVPQRVSAASSPSSAASARTAVMTGICACAVPGEVSPYWLLVLLSSGGEVVCTLYQSDTLQPDRISQLIAQLAGMRRFNCTARTVVNLMSGEVTA